MLIMLKFKGKKMQMDRGLIFKTCAIKSRVLSVNACI